MSLLVGQGGSNFPLPMLYPFILVPALFLLATAFLRFWFQDIALCYIIFPYFSPSATLGIPRPAPSFPASSCLLPPFPCPSPPSGTLVYIDRQLTVGTVHLWKLILSEITACLLARLPLASLLSSWLQVQYSFLLIVPPNITHLS